jgi:hypothetical protein
MYNYFLGGKDHYAADREAAEQVIVVSPEVLIFARENRAFLRRSVRYLVAECGIRQSSWHNVPEVDGVAQRRAASTRPAGSRARSPRKVLRCPLT